MASPVMEFPGFCDNTHPDIVILDVLQEEITNMSEFVDLDMIYYALLEMAYALIHKYEVKSVVIQAPFPRAVQTDCSYSE